MTMEKARYDVIVVGGGPSGLRTACRTAGAGLSTLVLDRKPRIGGDVLCTGIVGLETFEQFGLSRDSVLGEMRKVRLVSPFGRLIDYEHPRAFACVVDRERFDGGLAGSVTAAGGTIATGVTVDDASVEADKVVVDGVSDEGIPISFEGRMLVVATGVGFNLHNRLGLGRPCEFLNGAQVEVEVGEARLPRILFGTELAPGGFAWEVPSTPGRARIGLLTDGNASRRLEDLLAAEYPEAGDPGGRPQVKTKPIVQAVSGPTFSERVIAVGETAGQIKTTTGGGISYGLTCADIAADVILDAFADGNFGAGVLGRYETTWKALLERELYIGCRARRFCSHLSDRQVESLFRLAQTDGIIPIIRDKADFDRHGDLLLALLDRVSFMRVFRGVKEFFI